MHIHLSPGTFSAVVGIGGTGLALMYPEQRWIGEALIGVAILILIFGVRIEGWRFEIGWRWLGALGQVALRKAAVVSYERTQGKAVGDWVDRTNQTEEEKISYFIASLKVREVPVYARKPPSRKSQLIPAREFRNLWLMPGTNNLGDPYNKKLIYADAYVRWIDLRKHLWHLDTVSGDVGA